MGPSPQTDKGGRSALQRWGALGGGVLYGLLIVLAFPPVGMWPLALVAPIPLALAAAFASDRIVRAALLASLGVLPAWFFQTRWLIDVTPVGYPMLAVAFSVFAGAFVAIIALLGRSGLGRRIPPGLAIPVLWAGQEFLRGEVAFTGYPWYLSAHPLIEWPVLAAPAAWLGTYFVSFLVAMLAGGVVEFLRGTPRTRRLGVGLIGGSFCLWAYAALSAPLSPAPHEEHVARIVAVQTNVPQSNKLIWEPEQRIRDWERFAELTRAAAGAEPRPDLIVWPETMFPGIVLNIESLRTGLAAGEIGQEGGWGGLRVRMMLYFAERLVILQSEVDTPMLVGAEAKENMRVRRAADGAIEIDQDRSHNSVMVLDGGTILANRYDKLHLTPFGEVIPYVWRWPALQRLVLTVGAGGMQFHLTPGEEPKVFRVQTRDGGELRVATPICFEATMPRICRSLAYADGRPAADVLINLSNDGWFGRFAGGREQHLQVSRWRCVELGVPMVRAVNTGISAWIDERGRMIASGPAGKDADIGVDGLVPATIPARVASGTARGTLYGQIGEVFGWTVFALAGGLVFIAAAGCRRGGAA